MSPDRQLLLACCRAYARPHAIERPRGRSVAWDRLLQRADRLGVAALMHTTLARCVDRTRLPPSVLRRLDHGYYQQAVRNARLCARLEPILAAFSHRGVPVVVLKGAAIAELVYGDIALRRMTDLDVLVRRRDLDAADRLIRDLGYLPDESYRPAEWYRRRHHHLAPYRARDGSAILELHHHMCPPSAGVQLPIEDVWRRARPAYLTSGPALVLAPADLLLHLCVGLSAVQRFLGGLQTLCDVAAVIRRYATELDWGCLLTSARGYALEKHLYYGLWLARSLVAADVPEQVLESLKSSARGRWVEDLAVKSLIRTAALRYRGEACAVPRRLVAGVLGELLAAQRGQAKVGGLSAGVRSKTCFS